MTSCTCEGTEGSARGAGTAEDDWEELFDDESQQPYWYNHADGETTWKVPAVLQTLPPAPPQAPTAPALPLTTLPMIAAHAIAALPPPPPPPPPRSALPAGWETHEDDSSGAIYFFNSLTGETTWERPG